MFSVLEAAQHPVPDEAVDAFWQLQRWPALLQDELAVVHDHLAQQRINHCAQLQNDQAELAQDIQQFKARRNKAVFVAACMPS